MPAVVLIAGYPDPGLRKVLGCPFQGDGLIGLLDQAHRRIGFANPCAGRSMDDLSPDVPLFLARAGQEEFPQRNETLDRCVAAAPARNLPLTVVKHHEAPHAFDLLHDSDASRDIVRQMLAFMRFHLLS